MSNVTIPGKDAAFKVWANQFTNTASSNSTMLHLTTAELAAIVNPYEDFVNAYTISEDSKAITKGYIADKTDCRKLSEAAIRKAAKKILADPTISATLKGQLGLNPNPTPSGAVVPPADLTATAYSNGTNALKWKRNGNADGTLFVIEAKIGTATNFTFVEVVTAAKFKHMGQIPGEQIVYRVSAKRGGVQSGPSNEAIVYSLSEATPLQLEVAA